MKIIAIYFVIGWVKVTMTKGGPYLGVIYLRLTLIQTTSVWITSHHHRVLINRENNLINEAVCQCLSNSYSIFYVLAKRQRINPWPYTNLFTSCYKPGFFFKLKLHHMIQCYYSIHQKFYFQHVICLAKKNPGMCMCVTVN